MAVWAHREEGEVAAGATKTLLVVPTGRTAILSALDLDAQAVGAGALTLFLLGPSGVSVRLWTATGIAAGPFVPGNWERRVLHPGDLLRFVSSAGYDIEYWLSYLLLDGAPT